jgi:hypothetical protein
MALPQLTPTSQTSTVVLPSTGTHSDVVGDLVFGVYQDSIPFISGAVDQVAYTYKKLGGDVLDVELTVGNVYSAYEEAVLEYSYIVNLHQSKNVLSDVLGGTTASFNQNGQITNGDSLSGSSVELRYPHTRFEYSKRVARGVSTMASVGGDETVYSASFTPVAGQQDYDLQQIISSSAASSTSADPYKLKVGNKRVVVRTVFYKTPRAMWRFYGYYGGINVVGNFSTYGQFADDSTFQIIPVWQNKAQNMAYQEAITVRNSNYSFELRNNVLRLFPPPASPLVGPEKYWVQFTVPNDMWDPLDDNKADEGLFGVNNLNTLPFENIPYANINSIGKQWIRRFSLALCKEILGQIRGKFGTLPIPGSTVTLNSSELLSQAKDEQEKLREELKTILDELTYNKLVAMDSEKMEAATTVFKNIPNPVFVG